MAKVGEACTFGIDMKGNAKEKLEAFLSEQGMTLSSVRFYGEEIYQGNPFYAIVETVMNREVHR
jgi:hypothetical protein